MFTYALYAISGSLLIWSFFNSREKTKMALKKGSKFSNVLIFIGAWSTTKIPLLLFEATSMGWQFMLTRFRLDIPGIA